MTSFLEYTRQIECRVVEPEDERDKAYLSGFVGEQFAPLIPDDAKIISVDGFDGVGKTPLSRLLAEALGIPLLSLDDFLTKDQGCFLDALKLEELAVGVEHALRQCGRVIVEGCVVEAALERIKQQSDFRVYVVRTARMYSVPECESVDQRDVICSEKSVDELIQEEEGRRQRWAQVPREFGGDGSGKPTGLWLDLVRYHCGFRPHERANLVVKVARFS